MEPRGETEGELTFFFFFMSQELQNKEESAKKWNFDDARVVDEILVHGNDEDLECLRLHVETKTGRPLSKEKISLFRQFAQQRNRLISESDAECSERETRHPEATELEYQVGAYKERIEKPVREAVFALREKGYSSFESGFGTINGQHIGFQSPITELAHHIFSEETRSEAARLGAELKASEDRIGFYMSRLISDEEMTRLWNLIAKEMIPIDPPQPLTTVRTAQFFRNQQDAIKTPTAPGTNTL